VLSLGRLTTVGRAGSVSLGQVMDICRKAGIRVMIEDDDSACEHVSKRNSMFQLRGETRK